MTPLAWLAGLVMPACALSGAAGVPVPANMDFSHIERPATPNTALAAPAGFQPSPDITTERYPVSATVLQASLRDVAAEQERVFPLADYPDKGQMFWVARSAMFNFPDVISAEVRPDGPQSSVVVLYSRSLYGESDLGVNRKRLLAWIAALDAKTAKRQP
jgi:hypothetical protein